MPRTKSFNQEDMLDKAKDLFWRKGYNGTPPQDIIDETGLSRSSLYDTYGDKHSLFIKTLQRYRDRGDRRGHRPPRQGRGYPAGYSPAVPGDLQGMPVTQRPEGMLYDQRRPRAGPP
ncbi:TetR/AcrR family transcriptional regulator [Puia sp. P3]|uniref:TetR/AcrR family transcriptional regulator n=1 Tax=Puia sp. P3 TaxID=3423952 RepID=UPI003D664FDE